jgi:DNA-binding transcriptional ArsR family regulator
MSKRRSPGVLAQEAHALVFSALGDGTRLLLIGKLCAGRSRSISQLTEDSALTRQAITKHLRVLENVGLVHGERRGREILFEFTPKPVEEAARYLGLVAQQWEQALGRLKSFVESDG